MAGCFRWPRALSGWKHPLLRAAFQPPSVQGTNRTAARPLTPGEPSECSGDRSRRKGASDGLEADSEGRVYATDYEHNAIRVRAVDGSWTTLVHDPRVLWPDTLSLAANGYLYFTSNQWERMPMMHGGTDLRKKPYSLFRIKVAALPVRLGK